MVSKLRERWLWVVGMFLGAPFVGFQTEDTGSYTLVRYGPAPRKRRVVAEAHIRQLDPTWR